MICIAHNLRFPVYVELFKLNCVCHQSLERVDLHWFVQTKTLFSLSRAFNGALISAMFYRKLCRKLCRELNSKFNSFLVRGASNSSNAFVFRIYDVIPVTVF